MRFCSLGSGSSGNATLVEATRANLTTRVLIDCGLPLKQLHERLAQQGLSLDKIDAVFITHEHSDHAGCVRQLAQQQRIPIWLSRGTYVAIGAPDLAGQERFAFDGEPVAVGALELHPFTVAHDAREPLQLAISSGERRLGLLTDLGHVTRHVHDRLQNLHALILEFNHDERLLQASKYPPFLKQRIAGNYGHLSNTQASHLLRAVLHPELHHVIAAHLSEQNNRPELVLEHLTAATQMQERCHIQIANAQAGFDWIEL